MAQYPVELPIAELERRLDAAARPPVDPVAHVDALNALAWALRASAVPRANQLAAQARQIAQVQDYKLGQARAARTLSMTIIDEDGLRQIFSLAEEAKSLFDEVGDIEGRAASRDFLATLHEYLGNLETGLELALDALSLAQQAGNPVRQGYALSSVGGILAESGNFDEGVERLNQALDLFRSVNDATGIGAICSRLSKVLRQAGHNEQALSYAALCLDIAKATDNEFLRWTAFTVMAEVATEQDALEDAERHYQEALAALPHDLSQDVLGGETFVALGRLRIRMGALDAAEADLKRGLSAARVGGVSKAAEANAHDALAELYERQTRFEEAIDHLREAQELRSSVAQRDARNKLRQIEMRAEVEAAKKDAEIHRLRFVELHEMQSRLVEAKKMAFVGKLAAGAAHELNTPLGVIKSNTTLIARIAQRTLESQATGADGKLTTTLHACEEATQLAIERICTVAASLERFTQVDHGERRQFDVREGLVSAIALLRPTVPAGIRLTEDFEDVPSIQGWPRELNHAFMTVLQNALEAIDGDGEVLVETRATAEHVLVHVRDSGRGMSAEQLCHLFDVGWSHGDRTSMRLGLSAAYNTMSRHGGTIEVNSQLGHGTVVSFRFPRSAG